MTLHIDTDHCPECQDRLVPDLDLGELVCQSCGIVWQEKMESSNTFNYTDEYGHSTSQNNVSHKLGSSRNFNSKIDYTGKKIPIQTQTDLNIALKWDKEKREYEQAAIRYLTELYDTIVDSTYDDGLKKVDLEILKQHTRNMVIATGHKQSELDLMKIIREYVRVKIVKNSKLKEYFKLDILKMKIRYDQEQPRNISGRGNQIGKNRKENRIEYCNLCHCDIDNYKVKQHHKQHHLDISYNQYIDPKKTFVRRSATLTNVIMDCSLDKNKNKRLETGICPCGFENAKYIRDTCERKRGRGVGERISRLRIFHLDPKTGKEKLCKTMARVINRKFKKNA